jgi:flagellar biosynthesis protein FlhF
MMETRTIRAKSMSEALRETRQLLGSDALILSAKNLESDGLVEVTAVGNKKEKKAPLQKAVGLEMSPPSGLERPPENPEPWKASIEPIREEITSLRRMVKELQRMTDDAILPSFGDLKTLIMESSREQESGRVLGPIYTELLERGVMRDFARDLVRTVEIELGLKDIDRRDWMSLARGLLRELLTRQIQAAGPLVPGDRSRVFAFLGPSGVGKTTTLAKIASRMALSEGLDVVIITTDTYRVGSVDQARRYAELIGVPFVVADRPEMMASAFRTYAHVDAILIDTPGRAFENDQVRGELKALLHSTGEPVEMHMLMAATYSTVQQATILSRFQAFNPTQILVTKVDEASESGSIYNIVRQSELPISYLTVGQRVPEDIEPARVRRIVSTLIGNEE